MQPDNGYETVIVGTKYRGREALELVAQMRQGDVVELEREPRNRHDPYAIACRYHGSHLGYIPKESNRPIAAQMDRGAVVAAVVERPAKFSNKGFMILEPKLRVTIGEVQL